MSTLTNNSQMHNDIMAAGSKQRPPMLAPVEGDNPSQARVVREETYTNTTSENRKLINAETRAIHMILNGIGESINIQDVKTKLFWEFGKFTSRDGESIESYYTRNANPLALVDVAQHYPNDYTQAPKPYKTHAQSSRQTLSTRSHATTRNKGKEIVKPPSSPSKSTSKEDNDEEQA
ncbi:hypothetical protein Tco_0724944 [Tanacetum coccineum]|uniref:Uncharacterized protein n=1 Tax=Tanacetum coccineum TaxID=301880 RepID=A0ABQ4YDN2_9ASTR